MPNAISDLAEIVELIGKLWLREVSSETLTSMQSADFRIPYEELGGYIPDQISDQTIEDLAFEYCQLLIGPRGHISPVQSVWVSRQFQTESAASMNRFFDLLPDYRPDSNLSDHIGVQLDFLAALLRTPAKQSNEIVAHFVKQHLLWSQPFLERVDAREESKFYQGLSRVTQQMIQTIA